MDVPTAPSLPAGFVVAVEDWIAMMFYRTLFRAPATLLAVKHSFYFNETYGEAPQDRAVLDLIDDPSLRAELEAHLEDEIRHAALWRDYLIKHNSMPASDVLPFGDFVGMLRAAQWLPQTSRLQQKTMLSATEQMTFFAIIHVIETQAVRQMVLFREVLRERGDVELDAVITSILKDEGRHMRYSKRALYDIGARTGLETTAARLERTAQRAFVRLRAGDMGKLLRHVFANSTELSGWDRLRLRVLSVIIALLPTRVPNPEGVATMDASLAAPLAR